MFELHSKLKEDCFILGESGLSLFLLMNDSNYPWVIMVPKREKIKEIFEISPEDQVQLMKESSSLSQVLLTIFGGDKMNVASLGNMVPQLHIHHVVRFKNDPAWPGPVWGHSKAVPYTDKAKEEIIDKIEKHLNHLIRPIT